MKHVRSVLVGVMAALLTEITVFFIWDSYKEAKRLDELKRLHESLWNDAGPKPDTTEAEIERALALDLYPMGNGKLPAHPEHRALLYLKPHPKQGYIGAPQDVDFEDFDYSHHKCHRVFDGLVCTACYTHPLHYLGTLSVLCPWEPGKHCLLLLVNNETLHQTYGVDPAFCEKGG